MANVVPRPQRFEPKIKAYTLPTSKAQGSILKGLQLGQDCIV